MEGRFGRAEITVASMSPAAVHTVESLEEVWVPYDAYGLTFYLWNHKIELK